MDAPLSRWWPLVAVVAMLSRIFPRLHTVTPPRLQGEAPPRPSKRDSRADRAARRRPPSVAAVRGILLIWTPARRSQQNNRLGRSRTPRC
jgi:hypothetical protein